MELQIAPKSGPRAAQEAAKSAKRPPRDAKTAPRGAKRAPRGAKTRPRAIWEPSWLDFGPPGDAQTLIFAATVVENQGFRVFPKALEKETQTCTAQEAPRERPRATQERPESRPRHETREQKEIPLSVALVGGAREALGSHVGSIFE